MEATSDEILLPIGAWQWLGKLPKPVRVCIFELFWRNMTSWPKMQLFVLSFPIPFRHQVYHRRLVDEVPTSIGRQLSDSDTNYSKVWLALAYHLQAPRIWNLFRSKHLYENPAILGVFVDKCLCLRHQLCGKICVSSQLLQNHLKSLHHLCNPNLRHLYSILFHTCQLFLQ